MHAFVALLRGVNVGGKNLLPMARLVAILETAGLRDVRTYIQSGNVFFRSRSARPDAIAETIRAAIAAEYDFEPGVVVLPLEALEQAMDSNPFPEAEDEPKTLHLFFLESKPSDPDMEGLEEKKSDHERFVLEDQVFYLHAPDGIGRSKLAAATERLLGVPATARNWRTVTKIAAMGK